MTIDLDSLSLGEFYRIDWHDIVSGGGWVNIDQTMETHMCSSYGFLTTVSIGEKSVGGREFITLSATVGKNGSSEYNQHISIPIGCILSIQKINPGS